jgi:anti-sigma B factor antagonist
LDANPALPSSDVNDMGSPIDPDRVTEAEQAAATMKAATTRLRAQARALAAATSSVPMQRIAEPGGEDSASFRVTSYGGHPVLVVTGQIDIYTAPRMRRRLNQLITVDHKLVVVDLLGVEFMDSSGLSVLIGALKRAGSRGGALRVVGEQERLKELFRVTGLHKPLPLYPTVASAADEDR